MTSWFLAIQVRPAGKPIPARLAAACPPAGRMATRADEPAGYWLSTMPEDARAVTF